MEDFSENRNLIATCNANCSFCFLNYADVLGRNYLFNGIKEERIGEIIKSVHHQVKEYSKNEILAFAGEEYNSLYIIVKGAVVGELVDFEGKVLRIEELKAPETIASAFIFGESNELPVNVTALEDTRVLVIPRQELLKLFSLYDKVLHNYLNIMADRAQHLSRKIKMLGLQSIKGKLAYYLLEEKKRAQSEEFYLRHSQIQLSEMFGIARPSLARVIRELHEKKIIFAQRRRIKILDNNTLSEFLK